MMVIGADNYLIHVKYIAPLIMSVFSSFQVKDDRELLSKMSCPNDKNLNIKVVSIFGNTGEGKSYTLNQIFFNGAEVFK